MNFTDALNAVFKDSERIRRRSWVSRQVYGVLDEGKLYLHEDDGLLHPWLLTEQDYFAEDWEILTDG